MSAPQTKVGRMASWLFQWLFDNEYIGTRRITVGHTYDDELELLEAFMESFPGRKPLDYNTGKRRLAKYLNQLHADGWLEKGRRYNDAQYLGEMRSGWYPTFSLPRREADRMELGVSTAAEMGRRYWG